MYGLLFVACVVGGDSAGSLPQDSVGDSATESPQEDSGAPADTGSSSPGVEELPDPCGGATIEAMSFKSTGEGWVGCNLGMGLHHTDDGGTSFTAGHPSTDLYVFAIVPEPGGSVLVCGHDYSTAGDGVLLYRGNLDGWAPLLSYGSNRSDPAAAQLSNCGQVATTETGVMIVASNTSGDLTWSTDKGVTWNPEYRYWEEENLEGGYAYHYLLNLRSAGGAFYGAGSDITHPPVFFAPSDHPDAEVYHFEARVVDEAVTGEVWSMASPDEGRTWFVGGRDQARTSEASGFLYRSTDGGTTWESIPLGDTVDIVHDLAFDADGQRGIAVGHRYPPSSLGGFVLVTRNAGVTWSELDAEVPILQSAAVAGDSWWAGGDGWVGRGRFD